MNTPDSAAQVFRRLHADGLLLLANAWDGGSARLIESLGARALATSSAAVSWAHGYADGNHLPVRLLVATVADIVRVVKVPVSVDIEGGYSQDAARVGETVAAVIDAGAVGINIEDGSADPGLLCAKVEQAKRAGARLGVDLFVNVRTDVYLRSLVPGDRRVAETLARAERYRAAGADGLFVPGLTDATEIQAISSVVKLPLNVLALPGLPPVSALEGLGVRRLSAGSSIAEVVFGKVASLASAFLRTGATAPLFQDAMRYAEINALMAAR
ncbi:MAG: isocitrate lyase/phosphoenolpyruvate mutase family protein [Myxococcaceae bacterium]|nr:isocitrate lyase/phosphoenolpyruvate mutase family protein [Myxococcaceae bacterium]